MSDRSPRYELHAPSYAAYAKSGSPLLSLLAAATWIKTRQSFDELCDILEIRASLSYDVFLVSEKPPLNPVRADAAPGVQEFKGDIQAHMADDDNQ
jgi:hypothetical protein